MPDNYKEGIRRAAAAFKVADKAATKADPAQAFFGAPALAGKCAAAEGLPTRPEFWDIDNIARDLFAWAVMTLGWTGHDWESARLDEDVFATIEAHQVPVIDVLDLIAA